MFITFEGLDGSGKTTQVERLVSHLKSHGYQTHATREPGGTPIGDAIREVLHNMKHVEMHPHSEVLLFQASRAQLVNQVIRPKLKAGVVVISDRFADSTLAYQGYGHRLPLDVLQQLIMFATSGLQPHLTIYLDIEPEIGLRRRQSAAQMGEEYNRLDAHKLEFYQRVYNGYQDLMASDPSRWITIDANRSPDEVSEDIQGVVLSRLENTTR